MKHLPLALALLGSAPLRAAEPPAGAAPYPAALEAASVREEQLNDLNRNALILGNGDLNGLLWERDGSLCIRVAKSDVWDARVDTSEDLPLMKVDVAAQTWSGGGYPPSWKKPYPQPHCAALVRIGAAAPSVGGAWRCIRAADGTNSWLREGDAGLMAVAGKLGASAGYRWTVNPAQGGSFTAFRLHLSGSPGARYYVNVLGDARPHPVASGWRDAPAAEQEVAFPIPAGSKVTAVELYAMTQDGARVENRVRRMVLEGGREPLAIAPGLPEQGVKSARLDLRRAVAEVDGAGAGRTAVRALADRNVFLIDTDREVSLEETAAPELPAAETGESGGVKWLHMKMPGDADYAGMEYALAVAANGTRRAVALVTSRDTREPVRDAAVRLARETAADDPAELIARHEAAWSRYWSASGVALDDPDFQPWWYRMVYMLGCIAKPGAQATGLWAFQPDERAKWHGDYTMNYNSWQPFWTPFVVNHPDLAEPWVRYMKEMLPRLRWFAKTTYDCEGACCCHSLFPFEPDPAGCTSTNRRQVAIPPYGYTLGLAGMAVENLWYCHLYRPDRAYLGETIYPVLREVALFYCSYIEKCPRDADGQAQFGPSYSPEHGAFGVRNVPFDLAYARFALRAAITAAGELGRDAELAARCRGAIGRLPAYPTAPDEEGRPVVVDWTGCKFREIRQHNITVPAVPVFPADQVTWFSPAAEQELFVNTLRQTRHRGCNSTVMFSVAKARLSLPDALDDARRYYQPLVQPNGMFQWPMHGYYLSESVAIAAMISEYLVQSVENVIRVFPCWPREKDAKFTRLRAQGGFLVSAEQSGGQVTKLEIESTAGGKLRLLSPWPAIAAEGRRLTVGERGVVEVATQAGEKISFRPGPGAR